MLFYGKIICNCNKKTIYCNRYEFYGVQFNHFIFFLFLGFYFPSYFILIQLLGIIWEFLEYILDKNEILAMNYFGGCLSEKNNNKLGKPYFYTVYKNIPKYQNPIDKYFEIENSTIHTWHGSIAEIMPNIFGFSLGLIFNKIFIKNEKKKQ